MADAKTPTGGIPTKGEPSFIITFLDRTSQTVDVIKDASAQIAISSGARAFRAVRMVDGLPIPVMNAAGNLRGMVLSPGGRAIYNIASNVARRLQKYDSALTLIGIALELHKCEPQIESLWRADIPAEVRAQKITLIVSTAILRSVTSLFPAALHLEAKMLERQCDMAGSFLGPDVGKLCVDSVRASDLQISAVYDEVLDPDSIFNFSTKFGEQAASWIDLYVHFK